MTVTTCAARFAYSTISLSRFAVRFSIRHIVCVQFSCDILRQRLSHIFLRSKNRLSYFPKLNTHFAECKLISLHPYVHTVCTLYNKQKLHARGQGGHVNKVSESKSALIPVPPTSPLRRLESRRE